MKHRLLATLFTVAAMLPYLPVLAADTDLFVGAGGASNNLANVVMVLDNSADFSASADTSVCPAGTLPAGMVNSAGGIEACAIYKVIDTLPINADGSAVLNLGFMLINANNIRSIDAKCGGASAQGGCLAVPLTPMTTAGKLTVKNWILSWVTTGGAGSGFVKSNNTATATLMQETWAYYAGNIGLSGRNYASVIPSSGCAKNYVIFVANSIGSNGTPGDSTNPSPQTNPAASGPGLVNAPGVTDSEKVEIGGTIQLKGTTCGVTNFVINAGDPQHIQKGYYADEWARYMNVNYGITTYTVGLLGSNCKPDYPAILTSMMTEGKGKYFQTSNFSDLVIALGTALGEIQSVNSVFAAVSLPASATTQGTFLNQIYVGMFRPDEHGMPRWLGNLKQYQIGAATEQLVDADGNAAIDSANTGFITACARSFWTPRSADTDLYWLLNSQGTCTIDPNNSTLTVTAPQTVAGTLAASNDPDGPIVEKGAQGYMLRALTPNCSASPCTVPRTLFTCSSVFSSCTGLTTLPTFNSANVLPPMLGLPSTDITNQAALISWASGLNIDNELAKGSSVVRPSVHGDIVHSSPLALSYGSDVVVFYGANDGWFRAINGNQTASYQGVAAGGELWAFMPPEFYLNIQRLRDNTVPITFPPFSNASARPKPYGIDGPIGAFKDASNTWIFPAMRRGGRALYAFDVTTPTSPSLKWKAGCPGLTDNTNCTTGWSGIGQTWSTPRVFKAAGHAGPLIIMGGGYDTCEDADPNTCSSASTGRAIYVLDAATGDVQGTPLPTDRPVVADVTVVPDLTIGSSTFGQAAYAYAADLGGNIYRISGADSNTPFASTAPSAWTITKIASLGCSTPGTCTNNRKFMFAPSVVPQTDGSFVILLGSGDREKPVRSYANAYGVTNFFFLVKDSPTNSLWLSSESSNCNNQSIICLASLVSEGSVTSGCTGPATQVSLNLAKGWFLGLRDHEQVVTPAATVNAVTTFSTHIPTLPATGTGGSQCTADLGTTHVYNLNIANATAAAGTACSDTNVVKGGGLPPPPEKKKVRICDADGHCSDQPICIGCSPKGPLETTPNNSPTPGAGSPAKHRVYWYIQQ